MNSRILFALFLFEIANAQHSVSGVVTNNNKQPLTMVTVRSANNLRWTTTNEKGHFALNNISEQKITLFFSRLGLKEKKIVINFSSKKKQDINVKLQEDNLSLKEIVVTANLKSKRKTTTIIKRKAIEHLQASSLADVMQLIPGQVIQNQNFDEVKQILIRQKDTRDGAEDATSFGTNIRINGISISNNANLQNASSALRGNVNYFNSTAGRGNDLRNIATDNIEKIEVIKGIPSVMYGDITSAVVLIETKKGKSPLEITQRITPKVYQTSVNKGFSFDNKKTLNIDFSYTKALQNEREKQLNYNKLQGNLTFVNSLLYNRVKNTIYLSAETIFDGNNNDNASTQRKNKQKGIQLGVDFEWYVEKKWAKKIAINFSSSYKNQKSLDKQVVNKPLSVLSLFTTTTEGTGIFLPQTYVSQVTVYGKPLGFQSKITNEFVKKSRGVLHQFLVGLEYNYEKNFGRGVEFNPYRPPEGLGFQTLRERPYNQVPALQQLSFFAENILKYSFLSASNELSLGIRIDNFQPYKILKSRYGMQVSPRINLSSKIGKNLILKGGWGIARKSPSLLYLYPDNAFFDLVSLNYFTGNPSENLAILSTHAFKTDNPKLKVAKSNKIEFGFNYSLGTSSLDLVAYKEITKNAFGYTQQPAFMPYNTYKISKKRLNQQPLFRLKETKNHIGLYNIPENNFTIKNRGIELLSYFKPFSHLSFQLSGAYIKTNATYTNDNYQIITNPTSGEQFIGAYKNGGTNSNEQINTTLRSVFHVPKLKFVVSLTNQAIWFEKQKQNNYASFPYQYASSNGNFKPFDSANKLLLNQFLRNTNNIDINSKIIWLFNLNISKEIGKKGKLSLFINNMFNSRPIIDNRLRNIPFFYGFEAAIKL